MTGATPEPPAIPVIERVDSDGLASFLRSEGVQSLMAGLVDLVEIKRVTSYIGQASARNGIRRIRISVQPALDESEITFIVCHELAHHAAGLQEQHGERWRLECLKLVDRAGELGLLSSTRVTQARQMVMHGAASKFRGWPERAREVRAKRKARRSAARAEAVAAGVRPGTIVHFRYRGRLWRGEVVRVNRVTVSVGEPGGDRTLLRVPFTRLLHVETDRS